MQNPAHHRRDFWACFHEVTKDCRSAVEPGCGTGRNLRQLHPDCGVLLGIEVHEPYIHRIPNDKIRFIVGDLRKELLALPSNYVDLFLMIDVLEHLELVDAVELLNQADRIATKRILLWVPEGAYIQNAEHHTDEAPYTHWLEHRSIWYRGALKRLGYDVAVWPNYHLHLPTGEMKIGAMFCVKERP